MTSTLSPSRRTEQCSASPPCFMVASPTDQTPEDGSKASTEASMDQPEDSPPNTQRRPSPRTWAVAWERGVGSEDGSGDHVLEVTFSLETRVGWGGGRRRRRGVLLASCFCYDELCYSNNSNSNNRSSSGDNGNHKLQRQQQDNVCYRQRIYPTGFFAIFQNKKTWH